MTLTFHTRLKGLIPEGEVLLSAYADLMGRAERTLFALSQGGKFPLEGFKGEIMARFGLTARQFNGVRASLEGKVEAAREGRAYQILRLRAAMAGVEETIRETEARLAKATSPERRKALRGRLLGKKRRLDILRNRLRKLEREAALGRVGLCFGGRKRFLAQYRLQAHGYPSHEAWLADWRGARASQFFLLGSAEETAGNQTAKLQEEADGTFSLRLRLPDALVPEGGRKHLLLTGLRFPYGEEPLRQALRLHELERGRKGLGKRKGGLLAPALHYRFVRREKGWYLHVTLEVPDAPLVTDRKRGAVGVDLNPDRLALVETDRHGNPLAHRTIPLPLGGKTRDQAKDLIRHAALEAVAWARALGKPLVLEHLDLSQRQKELRDLPPELARLLSGFAYRTLHAALTARARKEGVEVILVNPAWTSVVGWAKYGARYGLSVHEAAALAIARRGLLGGRERLPETPVVQTREGYLACPWRPVRKRMGQKGVLNWLKETKRALWATTSHRPRKRGAGRPRGGRSPGGMGMRPLASPWGPFPGTGVPSFTVGDGQHRAPQ